MITVLPLPVTRSPETEAMREIREFRERNEAIQKARRRAILTAPFRAMKRFLSFILPQIRKRAAASAAAHRDAQNARRKTSQDQLPQM